MCVILLITMLCFTHKQCVTAAASQVCMWCCYKLKIIFNLWRYRWLYCHAKSHQYCLPALCDTQACVLVFLEIFMAAVFYCWYWRIRAMTPHWGRLVLCAHDVWFCSCWPLLTVMMLLTARSSCELGLASGQRVCCHGDDDDGGMCGRHGAPVVKCWLPSDAWHHQHRVLLSGDTAEITSWLVLVAELRLIVDPVSLIVPSR